MSAAGPTPVLASPVRDPSLFLSSSASLLCGVSRVSVTRHHSQDSRRPSLGVWPVRDGTPLAPCRPPKDTNQALLARAPCSHIQAVTTSVGPTVDEVKRIGVSKLTQDTWLFRGECDDRLKFEVEYGLGVGTTENSYVIQGPNGAALIDVPDQSFAVSFTDSLSAELGLSQLRFLVLGHLSPKRVDTVALLAQKVSAALPGLVLQVFCSNPAYQTLLAGLPEGLLGPVLDVSVIRPGETLDLGAGHRLEFIKTPTPRWPDGVVTYDPATQLIFTHKLFSAHICKQDVYDIGGWDVYGQHWQFFYDCMLAPTAKQIDATMDKLPIVALFAPPSYSGKTGLGVLQADVGYIWSSVLSFLNLNLDQATTLAPPPPSPSTSDRIVASAICPLHGPVVRSSLTELVREYKQWTSERIRQADEATIAVIFASAYGNTSALAQAISRGLLRSGVGVETVNCEFSTKEELKETIASCCGFAVGSPTLAGHMPTPVQEALGVILQDSGARSKPAGVFGSFGWSGEAVDEIEQRLKDGGFTLAFPSIRCKFKPTESMLQVCEESGRDLAKQVKKIKAQASRAKGSVSQAPSSVASGAQQAVGRVVGSLCVVSAIKGDAESAMLASWVSQASFTPPGITIAVAKERAVESLVLPGDTFAVSVLGEGKVGPIMKQLLKPFQPGEPRFGDLRVTKAKNGSTLLEDSIAVMECTVQSRMEAGDHWILYASVDDGQLQDEKAVTALHHRKSGTNY